MTVIEAKNHHFARAMILLYSVSIQLSNNDRTCDLNCKLTTAPGTEVLGINGRTINPHMVAIDHYEVEVG